MRVQIQRLGEPSDMQGIADPEDTAQVVLVRDDTGEVVAYGDLVAEIPDGEMSGQRVVLPLKFVGVGK